MVEISRRKKILHGQSISEEEVEEIKNQYDQRIWI